jgi:hypothetical protein
MHAGVRYSNKGLKQRPTTRTKNWLHHRQGNMDSELLFIYGFMTIDFIDL